MVGFDVPGTNEAVVHGQTGLLVPAGDTDALADALERLLADPVLYDHLVAGCHAYRQHISMERHVRDLEDIYLAALSGWRPSSARLP